jgi:hypothetical protein
MPVIGSSDSLQHLTTPAAMKGLITYVQSLWDNHVYYSFQERFFLLNKISLGSWQSKFHHSVFHRLIPDAAKNCAC